MIATLSGRDTCDTQNARGPSFVQVDVGCHLVLLWRTLPCSCITDLLASSAAFDKTWPRSWTKTPSMPPAARRITPGRIDCSIPPIPFISSCSKCSTATPRSMTCPAKVTRRSPVRPSARRGGDFPCGFSNACSAVWRKRSCLLTAGTKATRRVAGWATEPSSWTARVAPCPTPPSCNGTSVSQATSVPAAVSRWPTCWSSSTPVPA